MAVHDMYWVTEEAMGEAAPARILAGGERTELSPTLCLARIYEAAHPIQTWTSLSHNTLRPVDRST